MKSRRRTVLINSGFQLRFAFYVCSWLIALSFAYPLIMSNFFSFFFRYLALDPMGAEISYLERAREEMLWLLIGMQFVMLGLSFIISIFTSHKIAGPIYKTIQFFRQVKEGQLDGHLKFRDHDYFPELAVEFNEMMATLRTKITDKSDTINLATTKVEAMITNADAKTQVELQQVLDVLRAAQK